MGIYNPFSREMELLKTIPGVQQRTAEMVIGEIGVNMGVFSTAGHLASFAGICPGNNRSAGKRKPEKTRRGGRWLKPALIEASWAAVRENDSYLSAQYHRLVPHKGKKKAITAVAHSMIRIMHHVLEADRPYQDLGPDYFLKRNPRGDPTPVRPPTATTGLHRRSEQGGGLTRGHHVKPI
jgi:hypothetical protein